MKYAIINTAGDPYIFRYWLRFYDREVASRIDKLYVGQHGPADPKSIEVIKDLCDARNIKFNPCSDLQAKARKPRNLFRGVCQQASLLKD